jgi:hypothetical protein
MMQQKGKEAVQQKVSDEYSQTCSSFKLSSMPKVTSNPAPMIVSSVVK